MEEGWLSKEWQAKYICSKDGKGFDGHSRQRYSLSKGSEMGASRHKSDNNNFPVSPSSYMCQTLFTAFCVS